MKIKSVLSVSLCMAMMISVSAHAESRLLGDVNGDGEVSVADATIIQRHIVGIKTPFNVITSVADVDGDHSVTLMDATHLQRWMVNLPETCPISKPISEPSPTDRYVTVEGVTFDMVKVPSEVVLNDDNLSKVVTLMLVPQSEIDPYDVTTVVNNGHYKNRIDISTAVSRRVT